MKKKMIYLGITLPVAMLYCGMAYGLSALGVRHSIIITLCIIGLVPLAIIAAFVADKEE